MDNEEIRKLLQELKESSDESSAVRSKIVKIHFDTPQEAERRKREKQRAAEKEARKLAEEQAIAEAEKEARRLEAEKNALEVVEAAKREAKAGFAPDLEEDILSSGGEDPANDTESGDASSELALSWEYEKPELTSGFVKEEDLDLGPAEPGRREKDPAEGSEAEGAGKKSRAKEGAGEAEDSGDGKKGLGRLRLFGKKTGSRNSEDQFDSDEEEFRSQETGDAPEHARESISGLPGLFGVLSDRALSFAGGVRNSVKEDLSKAKERRSQDRNPEEDGNAGKKGRSQTPEGHSEGSYGEDEQDSRDLGNGVRIGKDPDWKSEEDDSWSRKASPDPSKEMKELPSYWDEDGDGSGKPEAGSPDEDSFLRQDVAKGRNESYYRDESYYQDESYYRDGRGESYDRNDRDASYGREDPWDRDDLPDREDLSGSGKPSDRKNPSDRGSSSAGKSSSRTRRAGGKGRNSRTQREYGPGEDWKRRMEEAPKKKSFLRRMRLKLAAEMALLGRRNPGTKARAGAGKEQEKGAKSTEDSGKEKAEGVKRSFRLRKERKREAALQEDFPGNSMPGAPEETGSQTGMPGAPEETGSQTGTPGVSEEAVAGDGTLRGSEAAIAGAGTFGASGEAAAQAGMPEGAGKAAAKADMPGDYNEAAKADKPEDYKEAAPEDSAPDVPVEETAARSIEVIDLNENQNNKEAEVIPLVGNTGALPDLSELKKEEAKRVFTGLKRRTGTGPKTGRKKHTAAEPKAGGKKHTAAEPKAGGKKHTATESKAGGKKRAAAGIGTFFAGHKKQLLILLVLLAVAAAGGAAYFLLSGRMADTPHETITADEGLTVKVLEQPDHYTEEGDVRIRLKAPETIQSVTVNGENVVIEQGRTVEFSYHATGGTLDIMAVSTDQVRNAKVILAYVDSQPPIVTITEKEGKIELNAEDAESGVAGIYIGDTSGLSDIPQFKAYSAPLEKDPEKEITYYAEDLAGNTTTPAVVALTPARSIAFEQEQYGLFPGVEERITLVTTPANAFVNNLKLESENPKVVQIEGDMKIKGLTEGDTKITATADGVSGVSASVSVSGERKVKISAIGDCTLGTDVNFSQNTSFDAYEALYGDSYFFEKVKGILSADDSTFANLEGTLTTSDQRAQKTYAFKGDPSYTKILQEGSIDVVNLANNHSRDYGEESLTDTQNALEEADIEWCEGDHIAYRDLNGVLTAYIGIYSLENGLDKLPQVKSTVQEAKKNGADLILVEFHWGAELVAQVDDFQKELAHTAVDEGANLVLGSHAHVLQGIEKYNGAYIVYGLGNFCFGGNSNPTSYDTMIWQQTFTFTSEGLEQNDDIAIIPCQVSGDLSSNNYQPVPVSGDAAANIMQTIDNLSAEFGQSYSAYMVDGTLWTES